MREILFRGKRTDNGEWVYGMLTLDDFITYEEPHIERAYCIKAIPNEKCECLYWVQVIPETIGQYTGLTDKNGTKIFEGDIIKHIRTLWGKDNSDIGVILWCENLCKFYRTSKFDTMDKVEIWKDTAVDYEVIGNIHDNLELIENEV